MLVLLLLLLVSPSFSSIQCYEYILATYFKGEYGLQPCAVGKCLKRIFTLSNGEIWKAGGCDTEEICKEEEGRTHTYNRDQFIKWINDNRLEVPLDVTNVTTTLSCCTSDECNSDPDYRRDD